MRILLKTAHHTLAFTWRWSWFAVTLSLPLLALTLLSVRLALPLLGDYRAEAQRLLSDYLQQPVQLEQLTVDWWGWGPELHISGLSLHKNQQPLFDFTQAQLRIDLSQSLWRGRLILAEVRLQGGDITLNWPMSSTAAGGAALRQADRPAISAPELLDRLHSLGRAVIELDRVWLQSPVSGRRELGRDFSLHISPEEALGGTRQVSAEIALAPTFGSSLSVQAQLDQDDQQIPGGHFYLHGKDLNLSAWPGISLLETGQGQIELWGDWRDGQLDTLVLQSELSELRLLNTPALQVVQARLQHLEQVRLTLQGQRDGTDWTWRAQVQDQSQSPPSLDVYAEWSQQPDGDWQGHLRGLQLADLSDLLEGFWSRPEYQAWLARLQPAGRLAELDIAWREQHQQLTLTAAIQDLHTQPWQDIPGLQGVDARLQLSGDSAQLELTGTQVEIDWPLVRQPIILQWLAGQLRWHRAASGWTLRTHDLQLDNPDFTLRLNGSVEVADQNPADPEFNLRLDFKQVDSARVAAYLPAARMNPKLIAWLDHALGPGQIPQGQLVLRGRVSDFPFEHNEGELEARFQVATMRLNYFPGWPAIDNLSAAVVFRNQGFEVLADSGTLGGVGLQQVRVRIPDMRQSELHVDAQLQGATATMLEVLANSPLREKIWTRLSDLRVSGDNQLNLNLLIPIEDEQAPVQVAGSVGFTGGRVQLPGSAPALENLQGELDFSDAGVRARDLRLRFLDAPARLAIATGKQTFDFNLAGRFDAAALAQPFGTAVSEYLRGTSDWTIELKLPQQNRTGQNRFELALQSDLQGTAILLPAPLGKAAASVRTSHLQLRQEQKQLTVRMRTDAGLSSALRLQQSAAGWQVQRGTVRIGDELLGGPAELPERNELVLQAHLPSYRLASVSSEITTDASGVSGGLSSGAVGLAVFDRSELTLDKLVLGDWQAEDVQLQGQQVADGYHFRLGGTDLAGELFLPQQIGAAEPVHLALKTLHLRRVPDAAGQGDVENATVMSPGVWPALQIDIDTLQLNTQRLGPLLLSVRPLPDGLRLNTLELSAPGQQLSASGEWRTGGADSRSWLQAKFYSEALGEALALLDIPIGVERAKTALGLDVSWPGTTRAPDLAQMRGTLQVHIEEGLLAEIKPGLGRLVGLVNVASLARRLTLDFSDLVETGLAFDQIDGTINFTGGRASTDDLLLQGPAVNIAVQGWLGLRDQQLQQTVTVMPQIASSLALAGAVAGGPAVGAAVLLAGQVLKPGLEKAVSLQYAVSGTLDTPVIERAQITTGGGSGSMSGGGRK